MHPNVARHHLDKLAAGGYVEVVVARRRTGERRAGRPSKRYVAVATTRSTPASRCAATTSCWPCSAGRSTACRATRPRRWPRRSAPTYGRAMAAGLTGDALAAGQRSLRSAMQAVADALTAHGFAAHMARRRRTRNGLRIINDHCPFGTVATDHPVICAVDRGMVRGMLSALYGRGADVEVATEASKARGDTFCATAV